MGVFVLVPPNMKAINHTMKLLTLEGSEMNIKLQTCLVQRFSYPFSLDSRTLVWQDNEKERSTSDYVERRRLIWIFTSHKVPKSIFENSHFARLQTYIKRNQDILQDSSYTIKAYKPDRGKKYVLTTLSEQIPLTICYV